MDERTESVDGVLTAPNGRLDEDLSTHVLTSFREVYAAAGARCTVLMAAAFPTVR